MIRILFSSLLVLFLSASLGHAQNRLVADLDQKEVQITTGFNGAELLLFGALSS